MANTGPTLGLCEQKQRVFPGPSECSALSHQVGCVTGTVKSAQRWMDPDTSGRHWRKINDKIKNCPQCNVYKPLLLYSSKRTVRYVVSNINRSELC